MVPRGVLFGMDGVLQALYIACVLLLYVLSSVIHELNRAKIQVPRISILHAVDPAEHSRVSDSTSLKADTKGLAIIMVKIGMVNATATNTFLSSHELVLNTTNYTNNDVVLMKKLLKDCADKYALATNALQDSLQDLNNEVYDYAYPHVMAAADYSNVCHNGFNPRLDYPTQLAIREDGFKHICDVVLGILDALGSPLQTEFVTSLTVGSCSNLNWEFSESGSFNSTVEVGFEGEVPKVIPFTLNSLYHLHLGVNFTQIGQTYYAFELIKSCPNLSKLEIWVNNSSDHTLEDVYKYIDAPAFLDQPFNKLKDVTVHYFKGSKTELFFIKLLLACTPSLVRMSIVPVGSFGRLEYLHRLDAVP
ncbi:hypothetical protein MTR67_047190 [Solanum verrucosum]|uniref:Pectinesterase inhibitor domain-containing protein n=1 Tax=Solanum verrucosum TaxID=315347 RepID=A0AAF0UXE0_SOLVR|nr:hypothetical protein MTR67_047190 [Solanum verrucosum]